MRHRLAALLVALSALLMLPSTAAALGTPDQSQTGTETEITVGSFGTPALAQTFTAGLSGSLDTVDINTQDSLNGRTIQIRAVSGGVPTGVVLASEAITSSATGWLQTTFDPAASVAAGTQYAIVVIGPGNSQHSLQGSRVSAGFPDPYVGGEALFSPNGSTWSVSQLPGITDVAFQTYVTPDTDADDDGVADADDVCPGTVLPDAAPPKPQKNHYKATLGGFVDVKTGAVSAIGLDDTAGCSAAQIVTAARLGSGHTKNGLSVDALNAWVASH